jgi:hypothetical protein
MECLDTGEWHTNIWCANVCIRKQAGETAGETKKSGNSRETPFQVCQGMLEILPPVTGKFLAGNPRRT